MLTFWLSTTPTTKLTILCIELIFVMAFTVQVLDQIPSYVQNFPDIGKHTKISKIFQFIDIYFYLQW